MNKNGVTHMKNIKLKNYNFFHFVFLNDKKKVNFFPDPEKKTIGVLKKFGKFVKTEIFYNSYFFLFYKK